jgi:hypothetical protein
VRIAADADAFSTDETCDGWKREVEALVINTYAKRSKRPSAPGEVWALAVPRMNDGLKNAVWTTFCRKFVHQWPDTPAAGDRLGEHTSSYTHICGKTEHIWCSKFDQRLL